MRPEAATPDELLEHAEWLRSLALRLAHDEAAAEDIVQDTWTAALRKPPRGDNLKPWLARVLGRFARRSRRGEHRRKERERLAALERPDRSDEEVREAFEAQRELAELVAELPEPYRTTVMRRYYDGRSAAEIARRSNVPAGTIRAQLARARVLLRERWNKRHDSSSPRGLAGLALITGLLPETIQQGALMKTAHSGIAAAACLLVAASIWGGYVLMDPVHPDPSRVHSANTLVEPEPVAQPAADEAELAKAEEEDGREAVLARTPDAQPTETAAGDPATRLLARILDRDGLPVANARLDAPSRTQLGEATSNNDGELVLVTQAEHVQTWRGEPYSTHFRIQADDHATYFVRAALEPRADTDLGDIELALGGDVAGRVVDGNGAPIAGAEIVGGEAALGRAPADARVLGPTTEDGRVVTTSAQDGSYLLKGLPAEPGRVWARAKGRPWEFTETFPVAAASETIAPDIVFRDLAQEASIRGVVLDPGGNPVPKAIVLIAGLGDGPIKCTRVEADNTGRFVAAAMNDSPHEIEAFHPKAELFPAQVSGVRPGGDEIELQLTELRWFDIALVDDKDETPLDKPWVNVDTNRFLSDHEDVPFPEEQKLGKGVIRAPLPQSEFTIGASATGYAYRQEGPFDPDTIGETVVIRLKRKPMVRGRVIADGEPVEGARVRMVRAIGPEYSMITSGFRARLFDGGAFAAVTDEEGRFEQPTSTSMPSGDHVLLASKDGWATTEMVIDMKDGDANDIEVVLTHGGSIEGRVLLEPDRDPRGALVVASNGDDLVKTARADEDGMYRFDNLTPGPWQLRHEEEEVEYVMGFSSEPFEGEYEGDCVVVEGQTTRHDVDARVHTVTVEGTLSIDGKPGHGWTARLEAKSDFGYEPVTGSVVLDDSGHYAFDAVEEAKVLILETLESEAPFASLRRELAEGAPGSPFELSLATGRLNVHAPADARLKLTVKLPDAWSYEVTLDADAGGDLVATLPAGDVTVSSAQVSASGYTHWKPGPTVALPAGGEESVDVD